MLRGSNWKSIWKAPVTPDAVSAGIMSTPKDQPKNASDRDAKGKTDDQAS
jgi:hypothetical protein